MAWCFTLQTISSALNLIHQKPEAPWTITKRAAEVGMSRSPFATKFSSMVSASRRLPTSGNGG